MIPCANPLAAVKRFRAAIDTAIRGVLDQGRYILGPEVAAFEREFAIFCESSEAVGVSSGTDGLCLAMAAVGVVPGDEIITVSHTAVATVSAIVQLGARPVLVDVDPSTYCMDPAALAKAFSSRTKAVIPVHLYGHPADLGAILTLADRHGVPVIEDCSQAHGARWHGRRVGTIGLMGVFSCYPTKNLGGIGDAGVVVTNDAGIASRLRELREYGWRERYNSATHGVNNRLDEIQAAILRVRLSHLEADNVRRREIASRYNASLAELPLKLPIVAEGCEAVFHLYVVSTQDRNELREQLAKEGVSCLIHYPFAIHQQSGYAGLVHCPSPLTETELAAASVLSLPIFPELSESEQTKVISALHAAFGIHSKKST